MIKKVFRLKEREVKKVLQKWKPFFSYNIVSNKIENKLWFNRFAIIIWWKSVSNNINRVFFRRLFYKLVENKINTKNEKFYDIVFVVKKKTKLDRLNFDSKNNFEKDIKFLIYKNNI